MVTKAASHFVDSDINPDSLGWECQREAEIIWEVPFMRIYAVAKSGYIYLNYGEALQNPGAGVSSTSSDNKTHSIPWAGHPFIADQKLEVVNAGLWGIGWWLVEPETTATVLVITSYFGSNPQSQATRTFDGDEDFYVWRNANAKIVYAMAFDDDENIYTGTAKSGNPTGCTAIKFDKDLLADGDSSLFLPDTPISGNRWTVQGVEVSSDNSTLVCFIENPDASDEIYTYDLETGDEITHWSLSDDAFEYTLAEDPDTGEDVLICPRGYSTEHPLYSNLTIYDLDGNRLRTVDTGKEWGLAVSTESDKIIAIGDRGLGLPYDENHHICICDFDGSNLKRYDWGDSRTAYIVRIGNDHIYVVTNTSGTNIYKFDYDLNIIISTYIPDFGHFFIDGSGRIIVINDNRGGTEEYEGITYYDENLNFIKNVPTDSHFSTALLPTLGDCDANYRWTNVKYGYYNKTPIQYRNLWYPSDHTHLEAEEVQVLGDGAYKGTETVSDGGVSLDDDTTINHVGLAFTSYLQPMKIDGEAYTKNIKEIIPQMYSTLGGRYGENLDELYEIIFRDRDDAFGSSPDLFTGHKRLDFDGSYNRQGDIWVTQEIPLPMILLGIALTPLVTDGAT